MAEFWFELSSLYGDVADIVIYIKNEGDTFIKNRLLRNYKCAVYLCADGKYRGMPGKVIKNDSF